MKEKLSYIKSLDGMRGIFCVVVIIAHWKLAFPILPIGWEAMQVFFVMSGFLITRILLHEKGRQESFKPYAKSFFMKRVFRIFPLYFGYLILTTIARFALQGNEFVQTQTQELQHSGVWLYTYLYNFKTWFNFHAGVPFEDTAFFSHLWSLSLEEQFYVVFPFIIYFLNGKVLKTVIAAMVITPIFLKTFGYPYLMSVNPDETWSILLIYRNIVFQFDSLAIGAAAAIFNFAWIKRVNLWFWILFAVMMVIQILHFDMVRDSFTDLSAIPFDIFITDGQLNWLGYIHFLGHPELLHFGHQYIYVMPLVNVWCFLMVLSARRGNPVMPWILENKFVVYLGKISYGLYVYHFGLIILFLKLIKTVTKQNPGDLPYLIQFLLFFVFMAILILISEISFKYFEMYFLKMKDKLK
jgi:peptidoglycan/LPS O-acetylase OafA/YrhL